MPYAVPEIDPNPTRFILTRKRSPCVVYLSIASMVSKVSHLRQVVCHGLDSKKNRSNNEESKSGLVSAIGRFF